MKGTPLTMAILLVLPLGPVAWAQAPEGLPDPDYCARRDADPARCFIQDVPRALTPDQAVAPPMPDSEYCARRDADPRHCVIQDGWPPLPIVRAKPPPSQVVAPPTAPPPSPAAAPLRPQPRPAGVLTP